MYQNRISLLLILAFSLSILISCGRDPGTNIKSGKVHTGYYTSDDAYYPMEYKRSDIVKTNDNYTISFKLPETEAYTHIYEKAQARPGMSGRLYIDTNGNMRDVVNISYYKQLRDTVKSTISKLLIKNYRNKLRIIEEEPLIYIERTDIKTEKLKNSKYYLSIGVYGSEIGADSYIYETYKQNVIMHTNVETRLNLFDEPYIYTNVIKEYTNIRQDDYIIGRENLNIAFITLMRDGPKDELKPIHVENYWFFNDFAKENTDAFIYQIKFQLYKFVDEIDFGYRGKLPPKPINEDDEY
ncbi:hypothetical protein [Brachyspira aalborgi]|uniref:DUF4825 domain-containing protein n=2 Tax=Brachyspira TaxID=29521 RepID=A0A5C8FJE1_9SPIR|nr:hypothetical protein [Brachyspira aalborgi]TXJ49819.1 hypothetical protein EPJ84_07100 [Brachyspira aalborgi]